MSRAEVRLLKNVDEYRQCELVQTHVWGAPGVTRERMYLETMERVLASMSKTILDASGASAPVPYIALEPLQEKPAGAAK